MRASSADKVSSLAALSSRRILDAALPALVSQEVV
jgi:hypothetical protein